MSRDRRYARPCTQCHSVHATKATSVCIRRKAEDACSSCMPALCKHLGRQCFLVYQLSMSPGMAHFESSVMKPTVPACLPACLLPAACQLSCMPRCFSITLLLLSGGRESDQVYHGPRGKSRVSWLHVIPHHEMPRRPCQDSVLTMMLPRRYACVKPAHLLT